MGVLISNRSSNNSTTSETGITTAYVHSVTSDFSGNAVINKMNPDGSMTVDLVPVNQSKLDPYVSYDSSLDRVVSVKPVATTLSSFFLKEQHSLSSGYENIFFKNLTSDVAWQPSWSGIKMPQTLQENRGDDGIYPPTARIYLTDVLEVERFGDYIPNGTVEFDEYSYFNSKNSVYGLDCILAEDIGTDIQMKFLVQKDGRDVYEQVLPIQNYFTNQTLKINFSIPLESHGQEYITIVLCKIRISDDTNVGFVVVRPALQTDDLGQVKVWAKLYLRIFDDKLLAFKDDLVDSSGNSLFTQNTDVSGLEARVASLEIHHDEHIEILLEERIVAIESKMTKPSNGELIDVDFQRIRINELEQQLLELQNKINALMPE